MKLLNKTGKDLLIPLRMPLNDSGVYQVPNHITVLNGESYDIPERAIGGAKKMGMIEEGVKSVESAIGDKIIETKKIEEPKEGVDKKLSEKELFEMNAKEQKKLLKELGSEKIPRFEKDRVSLILKLQESK